MISGNKENPTIVIYRGSSRFGGDFKSRLIECDN